MNYWLINPKSNGSDTDLSELSLDTVYMGWNTEDCPTFYYSVKQGDFIIVCDHAHKNNRCHYVGIADWIEEDSQCWFLRNSTEKINKEISEIIQSAPEDFKGGNSPNPWGGQIKSIIKLGNKKAELELKKLLDETFMKIGANTQTKNITDLLKTKKNIILQGAPGTGKTYTTAEVALSILGKDISSYPSHDALMNDYEKLAIKIDESTGTITEGQIGFVTFHQSMDYEDFIEGIKPKTEPSGNVSYNIEDGIFKLLANKAANSKTPESDNFEECWLKLIKKFEETDSISIPTLSEKTSFDIELNEYGDGLASRTYEEESESWTRGKSKFFNKKQLYNVYKGLPGIPSGGHDNYRKAIIKYMKNLKNGIGLSEYKPSSTVLEDKPYVLIIDEINRGNVSKIFGELLTLLEADKRSGGKHRLSITLPYSKETFEVPSNLYIIGTMNTTDRSVGNIDYAVRRRFSFVTLESNRLVVLSKNNNDESALAVQLFDSVMKFLNSNKTDMDIDDLMVGHSYFLTESDDELQIKWKYDILPLLREYYKDGITKKDVEKNKSIQDFIDSQNE